MQTKLRGNQYRSTAVCVDAYRDSIPAGFLYNPAWDGGKRFNGTMQFLLYMKSLLDGANSPQPFMEVRLFGDETSPLPASPCKEKIRHGKLATFTVRILFRRNASWQGSVLWLEGKRETSFRSVLELLLLMDSALNTAVKSAQTEAD